MIPRAVRALFFAPLLLAIAACTNNATDTKVGNPDGSSKLENKDPGPPLYTAAAFPTYPDNPSYGADPIRVTQCHLVALDRVDVPSEEDGTVVWYGREVGPNEQVDPKEVFKHEHNGKRYIRLRPGQSVKLGEVIALLKDQKAILEVDIARSNIEGAKMEQQAAKDAIIHYVHNLKIEVDANSSKSAIVAAEANLAKAKAEEASKGWMVERAKGEEQRAQEKMKNHFIRAPFDGEIVQVYKRVGEGVKAQEPMLQIQNTNRLAVEGNLDVQFARSVAVGTQVYLEPSLMEGPLPLRSPHASSKPITAVAAGVRAEEGSVPGKPKNKQFIVSASEDGWVYVWDATKVHASWKHAGAVRSLAVTTPGLARPLVLTGCDDGKARLWSVAEFSKEPAVVLDGHHEGGVQAAAFSPDGAWCVTSNDRGDIFLFDTETGKLRYSFPKEHNAAVTTLAFTPQCRVISAGRDNLAVVWKVGEQSAAVENNFDHRSGEIAHIGVSDDGGEMLLDLDKNRLRMVDVQNQRNLGTLRQGGDAKFSTLALISPEFTPNGDRVLLTAGGADGVLQVWRWGNSPGRGSELKKLVSTGYVPITCAAFTPALPKKTLVNGFIIAGTRRGDVYVWKMPEPSEMENRFRARITNVSPNLESSGKSVRITAEFENDPNFALRPGTTATMVIPPK